MCVFECAYVDKASDKGSRAVRIRLTNRPTGKPTRNAEVIMHLGTHLTHSNAVAREALTFFDSFTLLKCIEKNCFFLSFIVFRFSCVRLFLIFLSQTAREMSLEDIVQLTHGRLPESVSWCFKIKRCSEKESFVK